ncbi:IS1595 family transposase [Mycobacterium sp.]|uniref:IS1595 family transposase n=1 Tax=Mycobacterium sp. TaxID=1785 RepID=UPI003F98C514
MVVSQGHPVRGVDYPGTFQQLISWFSDEQACVDYLAQLRWGGGFSCPACGAGQFWTTAKGLRMCTSCGRKTSVTAGTVFHRSRTPLTMWFAAMWFLTASRNGISATNLHEVLGFGSYETAWAWLHKLRRSMVRPDRDRLSGVVEVDESFVGGRTRGTAGGGTDKTIVVIAVERIGPRKLGRVRLQSIPNSNNEFLLPVVRSFVEPGSVLRTDGRVGYTRLAGEGYVHEPVNLSASDEPAHEELPGVHRVASLLKRWVARTLHHGRSPQHFDYYLDEFAFRFNRRNATQRGLLFYRLIQQALATDPHPLRELIDGPTPEIPEKPDF